MSAFDDIKKRLMKRPDPIPGTPEAEARAKRKETINRLADAGIGGGLGALGGILSDAAKREEKQREEREEEEACTAGERVLLTKLRKIEKDIDTLLNMQMMNTLMDAMPLLSKLGEKLANETKKPDTSEVNGEGFEGTTKTGGEL